MSGGPGSELLQLKEEDVVKFLLSSTHLGSNNVDFQMQSYVYKRKPDGVYILNLRKTWEKLLLAARVIVAIENPADVCVISARPYSQRAILKFATHTGATPVAGRFTPGTFTNQIQAAFREPRLLIVSDPRIDHQAVTEASYVNIPVISLCNTDSPLRHIDVAIPCNNKGAHSIGLMWWMLAREVLRMRGTISRELPWDVMVDLYFYRDPEEVEKEEATAAAEDTTYPSAVVQPTSGGGDWGQVAAADTAPPEVADWAAIPAETKEWAADTAGANTAAAGTGFGAPTTTDWGAETSDWASASAPTTTTPAPAAPPPAATTTAPQEPAPPSTEWGAPTGGDDWA